VHPLGLFLFQGWGIEAYLLDWLQVLARWAHVIVGIAWIGASFYFIWLDNHLEPVRNPQLSGELWAIHGGGFYRAEKYRLGPAELPATLHWFKWEAYWTWLTGLALLVIVYYANPELYLVDPAVMPLSGPVAIATGLSALVVSLAIYEALCRAPLNDMALALVLLALLAAAAWALTHVFSGRGAFIHYGAILGTIMSANVAHVIIPGQRRMVQAVREGREPDPKDAARGKQRSVHNTYFTLPVVFVMLAAHSAMTFGSRWNWLVLIAVTLAGALIRVWFVMRHKGRAPAWPWIAGVVLIAALVWILMPEKPAGAAVSAAEVQKVIEARCVSCHAAKPAFQGIAEAPKGVVLDTPERVRTHAAQIRQTVRARAMPPGNLTGMSDEERAVVERWAP
jgi:uncharacterized membrane protein